MVPSFKTRLKENGQFERTIVPTMPDLLLEWRFVGWVPRFIVLSALYFFMAHGSNHFWDFWYCDAIWRQTQNSQSLYLLACIKVKPAGNLKMTYLKTNTISFFTFQLKALLLRGKSLQKHKRKCANSDTSCLMTVSYSLLKIKMNGLSNLFSSFSFPNCLIFIPPVIYHTSKSLSYFCKFHSFIFFNVAKPFLI